MGNKVSKQQRKIHDFSFPFMDPNPKSAEDFKALEEEKDKALLDKKRFAVRLSDVEELYAKKCDLAIELENTIMDLKLQIKKQEDRIQSMKIDYKICQIERTIALIVIARLQKENISMNVLLKASRSSEDLSAASYTQVNNMQELSLEKNSPSHIAAKHIIRKLSSELTEKDMNLSKLLLKLDAIHEEKSRNISNKDTSPQRLETMELGSQNNQAESFSAMNSIDSLGAEKSIFPTL